MNVKTIYYPDQFMENGLKVILKRRKIMDMVMLTNLYDVSLINIYYKPTVNDFGLLPAYFSEFRVK